MIVSCPACQARFRLDRQRLGGKRITLRCVKCREVFKVGIPASAASAHLKVLIAHADPALCGTVENILTLEGISSILCHNGEEILSLLETQRPQVALLDVGLPGQYVFELIEEVRRRPMLRETRLILLSAVYNKAAYKRKPSSLYGADDYIEKHHLPDDLVPKIYRLTARAEAASVQVMAKENVVVGQPLQPDESGSLAELCQKVNPELKAAEDRETADGSERERNLRIARMIAADIALYHQDRLEEGIRQGNLLEILAPEIAEGERILDERLVAGKDHNGLVRQALAELLERRNGNLKRHGSEG